MIAGGALFHLLQLADSALPIGGFSFSSALESAARLGVVSDAESLEEYTRSVMLQASTSDAVAAMAAHSAHRKGDYEAIVRAESMLLRSKICTEQRIASQRMGGKLASLGAELTSDGVLLRLAGDIRSGATEGCLAVVQGALFSALGLERRALFDAMMYGTATITLNAALRLLRITHLETQQILFRLATFSDQLFERAEGCGIDDIYTFAPQLDLLSADHERGTQRMFMN